MREPRGRSRAKPYDSAMKDLVEKHPLDWLRLAGLVPEGEIRLVDADLSTITTQADKVILVGGRMVHFELQSGPDRRLAMRILRYNTLLDYRHDVPVRSVLVLLRPEADSPSLDGRLRRALPDGTEDHILFLYDVLRIWTVPVEAILGGGLGTLPVALLTDLGKLGPRHVVREITRRIDREADPAEAAALVTTSLILSGLRFSNEFSEQLFRGAREMKESTTYQGILAEGRDEGIKLGISQGELKEARKFVLRLGKKRFGGLEAGTKAVIEALTDLNALHEIGERILDARDWSEALGPVGRPKPKPKD